MKPYDHKKIERKWQKAWKTSGLYKTTVVGDKLKYYVLDMFPYPSGEGLHVGHPKGYIATDVYSRFKKMSGFNILHPMGWDAFGLPAENYAIKNTIHPAVAVARNVKRFKKQLELIGFNYDWAREINTTDPEYYRWTQWIFLQMYKKGLAYESYEPIIWCPSCQTGLANEDLEAGRCERCGGEVVKKPMRQWVLKITKYADRLLKDLDLLNWPEGIKESQRNWIGRSEGSEIEFRITNCELRIKVFTTRMDTLFGCTYVILAPEQVLVKKLKDRIKNWSEVEKYIASAGQMSEIERTKEGQDKTGIQLDGVMAVNPANNEEIPIFIADYVLADYGTGAVMAVPAHDNRDYAFAQKYNLPIITSVKGGDISKAAFIEYGTLVNSGQFNGLSSEEAKKEITKFVKGETVVRYKLRDWVFSRQRYWGEPIPIVHCEQCALNNPAGRGVVPLLEKELPLLLPKVKSYKPTGTGESPLAGIKSWINTKCPKCGGPARRETNTMPQWAGSAWYYLRYCDPHNSKELASKKKTDYWLGCRLPARNTKCLGGVDVYVGGTEHATRHLIYARFWHKFLYDLGVVNCLEPFARLKNQGLILGSDNRKMSKRWGNVVNPDDIVAKYGADTLRVYEMFMGPFEFSIAWSTESLIGARRFLDRVFRLADKVDADQEFTETETLLHQTIKKVSEDIESFAFNTAISAMMIFVNQAEKTGRLNRKTWESFLILLAPFAPHLTEELWQNFGRKKSIYLEVWPKFDKEKIKDINISIVVQVNGRVRDNFIAPASLSPAEVRRMALERERVIRWLHGQTIKKEFFVPNKLINFVT